MKTIIFYFSGTGNTLAMAKYLNNSLENCETYSMMDFKNLDTIGDEETNVGFLFPVYFCGLPHPVIQFIEKLSIHADTYCFSIANYGGMHGNAIKAVSGILAKKGNRLSYGQTIKMPKNYIVMYSPLSEEKAEELILSANLQLNLVVDSVKNRGNIEVKNTQRLLSKIVTDLAYKPEKFNGGFNVNDDCINCGTCASVCKFDNITLVEGRPTWSNHCEHCMACIQWCPVSAINYKNRTEKRKRYHNPNVTAEEIIASKI